MKEKGYELDCDLQRFKELALNSQTGKIDDTSFFEARGALQAEAQNIIADIQRPKNKENQLDFQGTNPETGETIFMDHKKIPNFRTNGRIGIKAEYFPSHKWLII